MASPNRLDEQRPLELPPTRRTLLSRLTRGLEHARALRGWVEALRRRSATVDATFETIERDSNIGGIMLAGALSYRLFVFALPLAFFLVAGLGVLASALSVEANVIVDSVGFAGVVTKQVASASKGASNWWVALSSFFVLVYVTRSLLRAIAIVHALAWERTAASVKVKPRSLGIFGLMIAAQLALLAGFGAINHQTAIGGIAAIIVIFFGLTGLWLVVSLQVPHSDARWTDLLPGSLLYAVGMVGVILFNVLMLDWLVREKSNTYGALGIAATLLLGFFVYGRVIVGAAVLNATLFERGSQERKVAAPADRRARNR